MGQVVGAALEAQSVNVRFADFKSAGIQCALIPDCALISTDTSNLPILKAVGELKVPWIMEHKFHRAIGLEKDLRHLLSQIIKYMLKLKLKYGWISNYGQTIFLRQKCVGDTWGIEYSPILRSTDGYTKNPLRVSVRQGFFFLARLAAAEPSVDNSTPKRQWIIPLKRNHHP